MLTASTDPPIRNEGTDTFAASLYIERVLSLFEWGRKIPGQRRNAVLLYEVDGRAHQSLTASRSLR